MESKDTEKIKPKSKVKSMSIRDIPQAAHNKILKFKRVITSRDNRDYSVKEAYRQFIIEKTKEV